MSQWTHPQCLKCWKAKNYVGEPHRVVTPAQEKCCTCGALTAEGIYIREDPKVLAHHEPHDD